MRSIHYDTNRFKMLIVLVALIAGVFSLVYTQQLVGELAEREEQQIDIFAKAQTIVAATEDSISLNFLVNDILGQNFSIPVILTDEHHEPIEWRNVNVDEDSAKQQAQLRNYLQNMKAIYAPIKIEPIEGVVMFIYYQNSFLITQLRYFPYVQLLVFGMFSLLAYLVFSSSRRSEQNRVWVGLAKETAHQLGTPLSSLIAWIEYFKVEPQIDANIIEDLEKDVKRLETITARFSSIGSTPTLQDENPLLLVQDTVDYLSKRISKKVKIEVSYPKLETLPLVAVNKPLFEWIIENLCKNAVDAMAGKGNIKLEISVNKDRKQIQIDVSDDGKGIPPSQLKRVFKPGFTTKKRGWGLGLTLVKRIVENYHGGKIFVYKSELNVGTTFRILMPIK